MVNDQKPNQPPFSKYNVLRQNNVGQTIIQTVAQKDVKQVKSSAQVETCVGHSVRHKSCGLKSEGKKHGKSTNRKSQTLGVRFKYGELECIRTKAMQAGCDTNTYIRASALGSDYKQPRDPELIKALNAAIRELNMQGVNLNQIAKRVNSGNVPLGETEGLIGNIARSIFRANDMVSAAIRQGRDWPEEELR